MLSTFTQRQLHNVPSFTPPQLGGKLEPLDTLDTVNPHAEQVPTLRILWDQAFVRLATGRGSDVEILHILAYQSTSSARNPLPNTKSQTYLQTHNTSRSTLSA